MSENISTRPGGFNPWFIVAASTVALVVAFSATYGLVVGLKYISAEMGWPREVPSLAYAAMFLGFGLGGMVMGYWSDRVGIGPAMLVGGIMLGAGMVLASTTESRWMLYLSHGLMIGMLGAGALFAPLLANVTRLFEGRNAFAVSIVITGQSLAGIFAPPILGFAMALYGWRATYVWQGVFCAAVVIPLAFVLWRRPIGAASAAAAESARALRAPKIEPNLAFVLLFVAILACCVPMSVPMVHLIALVTDLGHPAPRAAEMLSGMMLVAVLARLAAGWLADRIGGLQTLFAMSAWQLLILIAFTQVESLPALYVTSIVFCIGFGGIIPCYAFAIGAIFPLAGAGWRIATIFFGGTIGMAAGGWLGGAVYDATGSYLYAFLISIAFNLLNLAVIGALIALTRTPRPSLATA